ncbi:MULTISPECIES: hydrolase [unclassified Duganella]|uniref:hydrolase n=1 Tax=unclassified Duganella TaxID=2636909 RepID=UPI0008878D65|nr:MULTISPECIES: hydrolase [unclassified Duganella]SDF64844.1 Nicotinamidase-related amidase [Duganella sp. OV458]SDI63820.1 Nicotinamidase-related amidase [Duganella sp. OV510]
MQDLLTPQNCALILLDQQAGLQFGVQSMERQTLLNNSVALMEAALAFSLPMVISTSASKVYSGPLLPDLHALAPEHPVLERRNMNAWEDDAVRAAIEATGRRKLIFSGMLTEACISFAVLSALEAGYECYVAGDACGGLTVAGHDLALQRMAGKGAQMTSWLQVLLELQRDWTRRETYDAARAVVEKNGGGYGVGLRYARQMLTPQ